MNADYITEAERWGGGHERRCQSDFCGNEPEDDSKYCEECRRIIEEQESINE